MVVSQKINGSNAQIYIVLLPNNVEDCEPWMIGAPSFEVDGKYYHLSCGSRNRWVAPGSDNYGFAAHVYAHKEEFVRLLGPGRHFGEWAGPGINSGEGLSQKTLVLFDHWKYPPERPLPPQTTVVPVLYEGHFDLSQVDKCMEDLKTNGSKLVPGFMRPEGVVVRIKGDRYKVVFEAEETQWKGAGKVKAPKEEGPDYSHLLQPIRLEKLISRDEAYLLNFPQSMPLIAADYFADLVKEGQVTGTDAEIKGIRKALSKSLFVMIKQLVGPMEE